MTDGRPAVAAIVLAAVGGARLERTLASVAWARERHVLDPAARIDGRTLPAGVDHVPRAVAAADVTAAPWLLLLHEGEIATPELETAVERALEGRMHRRAWAIAVEAQLFGARFRPWPPPVRLAARDVAHFEVRGGRAELAAGGVRRRRLPATLRADAVRSLEDAVQLLDADTAALAALLFARAARPRLHQLVLPPLATALRVLSAPGTRGRPWARWIAAVLAGYAALVVPAKLWELRHAAGGARAARA